MNDTIKEAALRHAARVWTDDVWNRNDTVKYADSLLADPTIRRAIYEEVLAEEMAKLGVEPVGFLHCQGNHSETSIRQLDTQEIERGWTQQPLHTAAQLQAAVRGEREKFMSCIPPRPACPSAGTNPVDAARIFGYTDCLQYISEKRMALEKEEAVRARSQGAEKGE